MENGERLNYMVSFVVNKNGEMVEIQTEKIDNKQIRYEVDKIFKEFRGRWLPGIYNGYKVDTKFFIIFDIGTVDLKQEILEKPYIINIDVKYFGIKTTKSDRSHTIQV